MPHATRQRLLCRAAELLGAVELAELLNVSPALLEAWISGHASMPDQKLALLAELLDELAVPD
jgi:hypothetical protein